VGFPKYKRGANWRTNFRTLKNGQWHPWLDHEHRCVLCPPWRRARQEHPEGRDDVALVLTSRQAAVLLRRHLAAWTGDRETKKAPGIGNHALFSIMTAEPNAVVEPVHEQAMPVLLMTAHDIDRWLRGSSVDDALTMQRPAADDALVVGPPMKPEKKAAWFRRASPWGTPVPITM
jgi:putative SOS response-associated peptidase YedK